MAGVSIQELGPRRYRLRWREWVDVGGERVRKDRGKVVHSREAAVELQAQVLRALESQGYWEEPVRVEALAGNLEAAGAAWLRHKSARGCSAGTIKRYSSALSRFFRSLRRLEGLADDEVVPTTVLSRDVFADLSIAWRREGLSESTIYATQRIGLDVWRWALDEPELYPGTPPAPRISSRVLPRPPMYVAPTPPTLAEVDACIRHLAPNCYVALDTAIMMRFTGLRVSQVLGLKVRDVNLARAELRVTTGKSRRERAQQRVIPISSHLVDEIAGWMVKRDGPGASLVRRRRDQRAPLNRNHLPSTPLRNAWRKATEAGEARQEVWDPPSRKIARPDHAFRAAFQAFLEAEGVRDSVIDFLVGHSPRSVRGRHYAPPDPEQLSRAVKLLPPMAVEGADLPDNVIRLRL